MFNLFLLNSLGYPAIVPTTPNVRYLHNQRLGLVQISQNALLHQHFLYYLLCSKEYRHEIVASATGTTVKHTAPKRIAAFKFLLPPLPEQRAIAHILGSLDDKIELNRKMNETLESIARAVFKSWFVDFDPVRAKMEGRQPPGMDAETAALFPDAFQESPLGMIPRGWEVRNMPSVFEVNPKRYLRKDTIAPYVEMKNLPTNSARVTGWELRSFNSGAKFKNGDVILARITPCLENGKTAFVDFLKEDQVAWGSTEYIVFRSRKPLPPEYAYFLSRSPQFRVYAIQNMTGTSGRQRVPATCFDNYQVLFPFPDIALRFSQLAKVKLEKIKANDEESQTLASLRDTLLPKLISGEIRIKDAEKFLENTL